MDHNSADITNPYFSANHGRSAVIPTVISANCSVSDLSGCDRTAFRFDMVQMVDRYRPRLTCNCLSEL